MGSTEPGAGLAGIAGVMRMRAEAGRVLFRQDDACSGYIVLTSGAVRVSVTAPSGRDLVLYRVEPGDVCLQTFACLVQGRRYSAEAVAETAVEALIVPPGLFERLMSEDSGFRAAVMASVARRFVDFESLLQSLAFAGLPARVAAALLRLADAHGDVAATQEAIAAEAGSAREAVSRQLGEFARLGLVSPGRGHVAILDPARLQALAAV